LSAKAFLMTLASAESLQASASTLSAFAIHAETRKGVRKGGVKEAVSQAYVVTTTFP
jgi:hypothetical protein